MGATGAVGPEGTAGAEALLPGQFYSTQTVRGATVTCTAVGVTPDGYPTCRGIMVNGVALLYNIYQSYQIEAEVICAAITGKSSVQLLWPIPFFRGSFTPIGMVRPGRLNSAFPGRCTTSHI